MSQNIFINKVAEYIKNNYNLDKENVTVIFPNKRAAFYLREALRGKIEKTVWLPKIISIEEAMSAWSGLQLTDKLDVIFELMTIGQQQGNANYDLAHFGGIAAQMANDFEEIDNYMVNAKDLFNYVTDYKRLSIWQVDEHNLPSDKERDYIRFYESLYTYYDNLRNNLKNNDKGYYGMMSRQLAEELNSNNIPSYLAKTGSDKVIFAGFNALTKSEETIIDILVKEGVATTIWDFDAYYVNDEYNEAGNFARELKQRHEQWFNDTELSNKLLNDNRKINLIDTAGNSIQAKALQEQLSKNGFNNDAVILMNEDLLIPVLNSIPQNLADTEISVSMGYPLKLTPINGLVNLYFKINHRHSTNNTLYVWTVFEIFDLDIVKLTFSNDELSQMTEWRKNKIKKRAYTVDINAEFSNHEAIRQLVTLMTEKTDDVKSYVLALKNIMVVFSKKTEENYSTDTDFLKAQLNETYKTIAKIDEILNTHIEHITDKMTIESLFKTVTRENSIKLDGGINGLQIMGLLETRNLDFETIHIISANEGSLPKNNKQGSFIPYFIRPAMGLPTVEKKQSVFAYHFYHLLQNCSNVNIYYNSDKEAEGDKSRFIMQIERELLPRSNGKTSINKLHFVNKSPDDKTTIKPIIIKKDDDVMKRLKRKMTVEGIAPTTLQHYISCPLKFCLAHVYGLKNNEIDENMQANEIGTHVHNALEETFKKHTKTLTNDSLLKARGTANNYINSLNMPQNAYNYLNKEITLRFINNYFDSEKGGFNVVGTEKNLACTIDVCDVKCKLKGTIDRIDQLQDGSIRIADYKTDSNFEDKSVKVGKESNDFKDIQEKARQLLIYKYLYINNNKNYNADSVTASIIGLTGYKNLYHDLEVNDENLNKSFCETMETLLVGLLSEIIDAEKPFVQTNDVKTCKYCDFNAICNCIDLTNN